MAGVNPAPPTTQQSGHVVSAAKARLTFPPGLAPVAALLAVVVGLLAVLPSLAQAVWEVPHLLVLGLVISYGVFTTRQRNADVVDGNGGARDGGALAAAWNARYRPDEPLIVVADRREEGAMERPLSLPVRRLKPPAPPATTQVYSDTAGDDSDDTAVAVGEETDDSSVSASSSAGFCARTATSPPSVLDADLGLSPCSQQPQSPAFFEHGGGGATTESRRGFSSCYHHHHPCVPGDETFSKDDEDGEVTDWDEEEADDGSYEYEMTTVSSERSSDRCELTASADEHDEDGDTSVDEELLKLASKAAPEGEDEVDRKADEFIAKFREQIRLQRL